MSKIKSRLFIIPQKSTEIHSKSNYKPNGMNLSMIGLDRTRTDQIGSKQARPDEIDSNLIGLGSSQFDPTRASSPESTPAGARARARRRRRSWRRRATAPLAPPK
jgi:hypothetical protein